MARSLKSFLTKEMLLNEALVLDDDQPYAVPENWLWIKAGYGFEITSSKRVHKEEWTDEGVPFYRTRELVVLSEKGYVDNELYITQEMYETFKRNSGVPAINDLLISGVGTIGIPYIVKNQDEFYFKDGNIIWFKNNGLFHAEYIYYLYKSFFMINQLKDLSSGTTVDTYTIVNAKATKIPLPPLAEQQRIVDHIESLFRKLDQAKEIAQNAVDLFETRKKTILLNAFLGKLTSDWRKKHGQNDEWTYKALGEVCAKLQYGTSKKSKDSGKVVVLRMGNLQDGEINWDNLAYTDDEEDIQKYLLKPGDVLFNRTNSPELVGKTSIYRGEHPAIFAGYLIRLIYNNEINGEFLNYILNSLPAKEFCISVKSDGVNQSNINAKKIAAFNIPVPSLPEQKEIVRILDALIEKEQRAKELSYNVINKIELMKKSILSRAFRGELGTNISSEKGAVEEIINTSFLKVQK